MHSNYHRVGALDIFINILNMSLDKAIEHKKEKRKPYYRSKRFDKACRCHGGCPYCLHNRMHRYVKEEQRANFLDDYEYEL